MAKPPSISADAVAKALRAGRPSDIEIDTMYSYERRAIQVSITKDRRMVGLVIDQWELDKDPMGTLSDAAHQVSRAIRALRGPVGQSERREVALQLAAASARAHAARLQGASTPR